MDLKIKDMKAQYLGQRVTLEGNVVRTGTQYPFCTKAAFQCMRCGYMQSVKQESFKLEEPYACENDTCAKKGFLKFRPDESTYIDAKEIEISDLSDDITDKYEGPKKVNLKVVLIGNAAETTITDQKYKFTGKFATSELGKKLEYLVYADKVELVPAVKSTLDDVESENTAVSQRNKIKIMKEIIGQLAAKHPYGKVSLEDVYTQAEGLGIDRVKAIENIKKMKQRGDLISPDPNYIKMV